MNRFPDETQMATNVVCVPVLMENNQTGLGGSGSVKWIDPPGGCWLRESQVMNNWNPLPVVWSEGLACWRGKYLHGQAELGAGAVPTGWKAHMGLQRHSSKAVVCKFSWQAQLQQWKWKKCKTHVYRLHSFSLTVFLHLKVTHFQFHLICCVNIGYLLFY